VDSPAASLGETIGVKAAKRMRMRIRGGAPESAGYGPGVL